jgi:hypothetical protein
MARGSKWHLAAFAVLAGASLGAVLAKQSNREIVGSPSSGPTESQRSGKDADEAAVPGVLQPLTAAVLKARVIDIFPVGYLTLMAIIQGAAFGLLFATIQLGRFFGPGWSLHTWLVLTQSFATGLTIVIVTHQYILLTVVVRWVPTISDTLIPYLLGFGEIWMARATGHSISWWTALSSLCAVAAFAFWHTRTKTMQGAFGNKHFIYQRQRKYIAKQMAFSIIMLLVSVTTAVLNSQRAFPALLNIGLTLGVTLLGVSILTLGARNQNKLYDEYRIPRWQWRTERPAHSRVRRGLRNARSRPRSDAGVAL